MGLIDLFFPMAILGVLGSAFWVWMIVDCVSKESSEGNTKVVWVLIIVLAGFIGALIYYFFRRPRRIGEQHEQVKEGFLERGNPEETPRDR